MEGIGRQKYKCIECEQNLILKKGDIKKAHFAHEAQDKECSYYSKNLADAPAAKIKHAERIHQIAIQELKRLLKGGYKITPRRLCSALKGCVNSTTEVVELEHNRSGTVYKTEFPIIHEGQKRIADLVRLDDGELKYIFEILDCNRTSENSRPSECEWFEFYADDIIETRTKLDNGEYIFTDGIELDCQRLIFKCLDCFEAEKVELEIETKRAEQEKEYREEQERIRILVKQERDRIVFEQLRAAELAEQLKKAQLAEQRKKAEIANERKKIIDLENKEHQRIIELEREEHDRIIEIERRKQKKQNEQDEQRRIKERAIQKKQMEEARQKAETKRMMEFKKKDMKCKGCNINYCKCEIPQFNNTNDYIMCNTCFKRKCECQHITTFFGRGIA